jgi:hypothetical protein
MKKKKADKATQPYQHYVTRFHLSGDIDAAKALIKTGEREMGILRNQLSFQGISQGYRETEPLTGANVKCSIVGTVRLIEIYVTPKYPLAPKEYEERPCFCNCCLSECKIVKVDGTWRNSDHMNAPLPDLGYTYGDRRLRFDIDVCSFLGISPESGLMTYQFYRVENVMPSDFTPYQVGDWAMVYFTDTVRVNECAECLNCDPPEVDALGRIWGCLPRDVELYLNSPQCIIVPLAINDRLTRPQVMTRTIEEMRLGVGIKKANVDWVQFFFQEEQITPKPTPEQRPYNCLPGAANITWSAWSVAYPATIIENVPIHYCDQDGFTEKGSHAFRPGDWVYVLIEGDRYTIFGRTIETLWYYAQYGENTVRAITPAILMLAINANGKGSSGLDVGIEREWWGYYALDNDHAPISGNTAPPVIATLTMYWDLTHDCQLSFSRYSWNDDEITGWNSSQTLALYIARYFSRGTASVQAYSWSAPQSKSYFPSLARIAGYGKIQAYIEEYATGTRVFMGLNFDRLWESGAEKNDYAFDYFSTSLWPEGNITPGVMRVRADPSWNEWSTTRFHMARYRTAPYKFRFTYDQVSDELHRSTYVRDCGADYDFRFIPSSDSTTWDSSELLVELNGFPDSSIGFAPLIATVTRDDNATYTYKDYRGPSEYTYQPDYHTLSVAESTTVHFKAPILTADISTDTYEQFATCQLNCTSETLEGFDHDLIGQSIIITRATWSGTETIGCDDFMGTPNGGVVGISSLSCRFSTVTWVTGRQDITTTGSYDSSTELPKWSSLIGAPQTTKAIIDNSWDYGATRYPEWYNPLPYGGGQFNSIMGATIICFSGSAPFPDALYYEWQDRSVAAESAWINNSQYPGTNERRQEYLLRDKSKAWQSRSDINRTLRISFVELDSRRNDPMRPVTSPQVGGVDGGAVRNVSFPGLANFIVSVEEGTSGLPNLHQEYLDGWFDMTIDHLRFLSWERNVNGYYYRRAAPPYGQLVDSQYLIDLFMF